MSADQPSHVKLCAKCGAALAEHSARGLCPACLVRSLLEPVSPAPPAVPPGYRLETLLGRGGMGVVWRARQVALGRDVALKVLRGGASASDTEKSRLLREAEAMARLRHHGIAIIHEICEFDGQIILAMEYFAGGSLAERLRAGPISLSAAARLLRQLADAVAHAHDHGVVHRDLKPSNVLLDQGGAPHLTDFGLAKILGVDSDLTLSGQTLGTVHYLAPEQVGGPAGGVGPAADIHALGAILYQCLTGRPPFLGESFAETLRQVTDTDPPPPRLLNPAVPEDLETVCLKCLRKGPTQRYSSASELRDDLGRFLQNEPVMARPIGWSERAALWRRRNPGRALAALTAGLSLLFAIGVTFWHSNRMAAANARLAGVVARVTLEHACQLARVDDAPRAVATLAAHLRDQPADRAAATRLLYLLSQRTWLLPIAEIHPLRAQFSAACFSPDGRLLITAETNGTLAAWDPNRWANLCEIRPVIGPLAALDFTADSRHLVARSADGKLAVFKTHVMLEGAGASPITVIQAAASFAQASPDGRFLAFGATNRGVTVVELPSGKSVAALLPLAVGDLPNDAAFSADGCWLAVALRSSGTNEVRFFSTTNWQMSAAVVQTPVPVLKLCASPFGSDFLMLDAANDVRRGRFNVSSSGLVSAPELHNADIHFSPSGDGVLTARRIGPPSVLQLRSLVTGQGRFLALSNCAAMGERPFTPDGLTFGASVGDLQLRLFNAHTGLPVSELFNLGRFIEEASFSPDGARLVVILPERILVCEARPGQMLAPWLGASAADLAFAPQGDTVAVSLSDALHFFDPITWHSAAKVLANQGPFTNLRFDRTGHRLLCIKSTGQLQVLNPLPSSFPAVRPIAEITLQGASNVVFAEFLGEGASVIAVTTHFEVELWDSASGALQAGPLPLLQSSAAALPNGSSLFDFAVSQNGQYWGTASQSAGVQLGSTHPLRFTRQFHQAAPPICLAFSPDARWVATGDMLGTVRICDCATGNPIGLTMHHDDVTYSVAFNPNGNRLVTGAGQGQARMWSIPDVRLLAELHGHRGEVGWVGFSANGAVVGTTASDRVLRLWDAATGFPLNDGEPGIFGIKKGGGFSPDGRWWWTSRKSQTLRVLPLLSPDEPAPGWLPELAEAVAGRQLNEAGPEKAAPSPFLALRARLTKLPGNDFYARWVRWFLADRGSRVASPNAAFTVNELVARWNAEPPTDSSTWILAARLAPTNATVCARLAQFAAEDSEHPRLFGEADFLSRRALTLDPQDAVARRLRDSLAVKLHAPATPAVQK